MALTGDDGKLQALISGLENAGRRVMPAAIEAAEEGVSEQYQGDFKGQHDPWGERWKPTRAGKSPALIGPTRSLSNPIITSRGSTVRVKPVSYWVFHQVGANNMERRATLPFGPSHWDDPIEDRIEDAVIGALPKGDP